MPVPLSISERNSKRRLNGAIVEEERKKQRRYGSITQLDPTPLSFFSLYYLLIYYSAPGLDRLIN